MHDAGMRFPGAQPKAGSVVTAAVERVIARGQALPGANRRFAERLPRDQRLRRLGLQAQARSTFKGKRGLSGGGRRRECRKNENRVGDRGAHGSDPCTLMYKPTVARPTTNSAS